MVRRPGLWPAGKGRHFFDRMQVSLVRTDSLIEYARNPRKNDAAVDAVAASLREFGWKQPIVIDRDNVVVAGHTRLKAAKKLGMKEVPVVVAEDLTPEQVKAYRILDNAAGARSEWDGGMLTLEIDEIDLDLRDFDLTLDDLIDVAENADGEESAAITEDEAPPVPDDPVTWPGDLWILGEHRVLCGDSTKAEDVERVMGGDRAALMNTDPPYGVAYTDEARVAAERAHGRQERKAKWADGIKNDAMDGPALQAFLESVIRTAVPHLVDNCAFYLWHPMLTQGTFFAAAAAAADILIHRQIIWVKPGLLFGFGDYHWKHELCFYGWRRGNRPEFYGPRNQTTVWELGHDTSAGNREHPTQKPVELFAIPMRNHTKEGEVVYEPFSGSGSQLIAAEHLKRRCRAMELEPRYVDVAVQRWQNLTGKKATLESSGKTFEEVAAERKLPKAEPDVNGTTKKAKRNPGPAAVDPATH